MKENVIKEVAWVGSDYVQGKINGVILTFHGLGGGSKGALGTEEMEWAAKGGLVVFPYYGPWAWMNRQARAMIDDLVDALYLKHGLSDKVPLICVGGSMGGQGSLLYTRYAKRPVRACYANCPVCDLEYHFHERPDLPPTVRHAMGYPDDMQPMLTEHSPLQQVSAMPDIPYLIIHGGKDTAVNKQHHSDKLVAAMRARKMKVEYIEVPGMGHCGPLPLNVVNRSIEFILAGMGQQL